MINALNVIPKIIAKQNLMETFKDNAYAMMDIMMMDYKIYANSALIFGIYLNIIFYYICN